MRRTARTSADTRFRRCLLILPHPGARVRRPRRASHRTSETEPRARNSADARCGCAGPPGTGAVVLCRPLRPPRRLACSPLESPGPPSRPRTGPNEETTRHGSRPYQPSQSRLDSWEHGYLCRPGAPAVVGRPADRDRRRRRGAGAGGAVVRAGDGPRPDHHHAGPGHHGCRRADRRIGRARSPLEMGDGPGARGLRGRLRNGQDRVERADGRRDARRRHRHHRDHRWPRRARDPGTCSDDPGRCVRRGAGPPLVRNFARRRAERHFLGAGGSAASPEGP